MDQLQQNRVASAAKYAEGKRRRFWARRDFAFTLTNWPRRDDFTIVVFPFGKPAVEIINDEPFLGQPSLAMNKRL